MNSKSGPVWAYPAIHPKPTKASAATAFMTFLLIAVFSLVRIFPHRRMHTTNTSNAPVKIQVTPITFLRRPAGHIYNDRMIVPPLVYLVVSIAFWQLANAVFMPELLANR